MRNHNSALRRPALIALGVLLGCAGPALGDATSEPPVYESALFKKLDANRDLCVTRAEAKRVRGFDAAFTEADENRDGRLSPDEFVKAESIHERSQAATYLDDSVITAKVKLALARDLPATAVSVETHRGRVLLSGFVDDEQDVRRAREIAASVRGVAKVSSGLQIK